MAKEQFREKRDVNYNPQTIKAFAKQELIYNYYGDDAYKAAQGQIGTVTVGQPTAFLNWSPGTMYYTDFIGGKLSAKNEREAQAIIIIGGEINIGGSGVWEWKREIVQWNKDVLVYKPANAGTVYVDNGFHTETVKVYVRGDNMSSCKGYLDGLDSTGSFTLVNGDTYEIYDNTGSTMGEGVGVYLHNLV